MAKKLTYEEVKEYIESQGYKLLSKEYVNAHSKLLVECPEGHKYETTWNNFKNSYRCKTCATNKNADNNRLTHEYVREELAKKGFILIDEYINSSTKMTIQDKEGYLYSITWDNFKIGYNPNGFSTYNQYTIQNIKLWIKNNAEGYELLSTKYKNSNKDKLQFKCPKCKHTFDITWDSFKRGSRCDVCVGKRVIKGYNDIATTNLWIMRFLKNKEDGYKYSYGSYKKVDVICPYCGEEKKMKISDIYKCKGVCCKICGDGVSYPEKFIIELLNQLNIKYIREYKPEWSNNKRYDFYFEYGDKKRCIIECNGNQHYSDNNNFSYCGGRTLEEEQKNDQYKKELALLNNINEYIILDCRESNSNWIKSSILNSKLNDMFSLSKVDWLKCEEFALGNRVKEVCDYWKLHNEINNEGLTVSYIGDIFNLNYNTIVNYLRKGAKFGWCNCNSKGKMIKNVKPIEIFKNEESLGVFLNCGELEKQSEKLFNIKLFQGNISAVCNGKRKHYKGFTFRYITKEEYESRIS